MNITPVNTNSNNIFTQPNDNDIMKLLEKQKMQLQEQIQKVNESKLEDKTKQERIKQLQEQIQQIDAKIQQIQTEKLNRNTNRNTGWQDANGQQDQANDGNGNNLAGMSQLVQAGASYSQAKIINSTRNSLDGKSNILKMEIKLDEGRGGSPKAKKAELSEIESRAQMLDEKVGDTLQASQKHVKEASKEAGRNENNEDKNAIDKGFTDDDIDKNKNTKVPMPDSSVIEQSLQQHAGSTGQISNRIDIKV